MVDLSDWSDLCQTATEPQKPGATGTNKYRRISIRSSQKEKYFWRQKNEMKLKDPAGGPQQEYKQMVAHIDLWTVQVERKSLSLFAITSLLHIKTT
jgi:hypothetical protein